MNTKVRGKYKPGYAVMLAIAFLASLIIPHQAYAGGNPIDDCGSNLACDYSSYEDDTYTLYINPKSIQNVENNGMNDFGEIASPWYSCGISDKIKEIDMSYGVYSIGENAFEGMTKLTEVYIPFTVKDIKANAFNGCQNLKVVYFGGTEEEWEVLEKKASDAGYNDSLLNANIVCMDQGRFMLDLTKGEATINRAQETILTNTLNYFVKQHAMSVQEEPFTAYSVDYADKNYDIRLYVESLNEIRVDLMDDTSLANSIAPLSMYDFRDLPFSSKTIYDYCLGDIIDKTDRWIDGTDLSQLELLTLPYHKCYYSTLQIKTNEQDKGEVTIDLRDKMFETTDDNYDYIFGTFVTYNSCYTAYTDYKDSIFNSSGLIYDMVADLNKDGNYDIKIQDSGSKLTIEKLDGAKDNMEISIADKVDFKDYMTFDNAYYYYSTVRFKFKDDVVKVNQVPATCDKPGTEEYWKSIDNGNIYADAKAEKKLSAPTTIPALGHKWGEWKVVKAATVNEEGIEERVCQNDPAHAETRAIPKLVKAEEKAPEVEKKGSVIKDENNTAEFEVTSDDPKNPTVEYKKPANAKSAKAEVPDTITYNGITYNVVSIAPNAFKGKTKLTSLVIGKNVKKIGKNAYNGCTSLKNIWIKTTKLTKKSVGANAFKNIHPKAKARVPKKKLKAYKKILKARGMKGKKQKIKVK